MIVWLSGLHMYLSLNRDQHTQREREREREKIDIWRERGRQAEELVDQRRKMRFWCGNQSGCLDGKWRFTALPPLVCPRCKAAAAAADSVGVLSCYQRKSLVFHWICCFVWLSKVQHEVSFPKPRSHFKPLTIWFITAQKEWKMPVLIFPQSMKICF